MQTYSHLLLNVATLPPLGHIAERKGLPPLRRGAVIIGSAAPDLILIGISVVCGIVDLSRGDFGTRDSLLHVLFRDWFFHNPWVITAQNLLHSPVIVIFLLGLSLLLWKFRRPGASWLFWFSLSVTLHVLCDIPVHYDDGPLLLFPFEWKVRFQSPVSYWDPAHYGREFALFEHVLDLVLVGVLVIRWRRFKKSAKIGNA